MNGNTYPDDIATEIKKIRVGTSLARAKFSEIVKATRLAHPNVVQIGSDKSTFLDDITKESVKTNTTLKIVSVCLVLYLAIILPITIQYAARLSSGLMSQTLSFFVEYQIHSSNFRSLIWAIVVSTVILFVAPFSFLVEDSRPIEIIAKKLNIIRHQIDPSSPRYIFFSIISLMLGTFLLLTLMSPLKTLYPSLFEWSVWLWLFIFLLSVGAIVICAVGIIGIYIILAVMNRKGSFDTMNPRGAILQGLILLLFHIHQAESLADLKNADRDTVVNLMSTIGEEIAKVYNSSEQPDNWVTEWSTREMQRAADNFVALVPTVYFPQDGGKEWLTNELVAYLNIFLTGKYHELPRDESRKFFTSSKKVSEKLSQKIWFIGMIMLYLALPIIVFFFFVSTLQIELHPLIQTALSVFYVIWAALGIISFAEKFSPAVKEIFSSFIKSALGGK